MCMQNNHKESNFCFYPLSKELNGQPQTAADQILSVKVRKTCPALFDLDWHCSHESHERAAKERGAVLSVCICMHKATLSLSCPFLLCMDQYSWHVLPLCRINSNGEKQPLTASVHTAFLRHCMKIDGFDIISKASLSHMPAVEGTGWDQPVLSIPTIMLNGLFFITECISSFMVFFLWLLIFTITLSYTNTLERGAEEISFLVYARATILNTLALIKADKCEKRQLHRYQPECV